MQYFLDHKLFLMRTFLMSASYLMKMLKLKRLNSLFVRPVLLLIPSARTHLDLLEVMFLQVNLHCCCQGTDTPCLLVKIIYPPSETKALMLCFYLFILM